MRLRSGMPGKLPPPVDDIEPLLDPASRAMLDHALAEAVVGSPDTVRQGVSEFVSRTGVDEIIVTAQIYNHAARVKSYELLARVREELTAAA